MRAHLARIQGRFHLARTYCLLCFFDIVFLQRRTAALIRLLTIASCAAHTRCSLLCWKPRPIPIADHLSVCFCCPCVSRLLLVALCLTDRAGLTPLHWSSVGKALYRTTNDAVQCVELMLKHGARLRRDSEGSTPLKMVITGSADDESALALLTALMAAPNSAKHINEHRRGSSGSTERVWANPLTNAALAGFRKCAEFLLSHKADPNFSDGVPGTGEDTPLHMAIRVGHLEVAKLLVASGACAHPFFWHGSGNGNKFQRISLSQYARHFEARANVITWCRSVESHAMYTLRTCDKCGLEDTPEGRLRLTQAAVAARESIARESSEGKCSNVECKSEPHWFQRRIVGTRGQIHRAPRAVPLQLKKCSACKQAAYCSTQCQRQHWKNGHKTECALLAAKMASAQTASAR